MKKKLLYRHLFLLTTLFFFGEPAAQAGTIYLYVENKTNDAITTKPYHQKVDVDKLYKNANEAIEKNTSAAIERFNVATEGFKGLAIGDVEAAKGVLRHSVDFRAGQERNRQIEQENATPSTVVKPHSTQDVASIDGTPDINVAFKDDKVIELILPKLEEKVYLRAGSKSKYSLPTNVLQGVGTTSRSGLNWDVSLDSSILRVGDTEDVPGGQRIFTIKQNKNCSRTCLFYKITAKKKTYPIRAPDIYFTIEEVTAQ